ncbi:hypothetical protein JXD20_01160 [Candidatus Peregrinibacteria bacterium]|nr:hypothetical protein [Candidatus Peregrinibacteria bacterium]
MSEVVPSYDVAPKIKGDFVLEPAVAADHRSTVFKIVNPETGLKPETVQMVKQHREHYIRLVGPHGEGLTVMCQSDGNGQIHMIQSNLEQTYAFKASDGSFIGPVQ